jgi:DNA-binding transcriptional LysR family regulator
MDGVNGEDVHLRHLRYFVAAAEESQFTRAAERLSVSQPALSRQIRRLERLLGTALFERDRRAVVLTDAGRALLPAAQRIVEVWEDTSARLREVTISRRGLPQV